MARKSLFVEVRFTSATIHHGPYSYQEVTDAGGPQAVEARVKHFYTKDGDNTFRSARMESMVRAEADAVDPFLVDVA